MRKFRRKILVLFLVIWLNLFQPVMVFSQEVTPEITPPEPTPTSAAVIETGDDAAGSGNEVIVNSTGVSLPGDIGTCNLEIGCSEVNNQNTADIGTSTAVEGDSGNNKIGATVSISTVDTGNVVGLINSENTINQNQIVIIVETPLEATPTASSLVVNNNQATVDNNDSGSGNSGNNQVNNSGGNGAIDTGNVTVAANVINQVNTNQVGSNIKIYIVNNPTTNGKQDLDLNEIWRNLMSVDNSGISVVDVTNQIIVNQNQGNISNLMMLTANSGNNVMNVSGDGQTTTGNVTVLANLINLLNINLVGSRIFLGVINIRGENLGNIILPNPEIFASLNNNQNSGKETTFQWLNEANIDQNIQVSANSGENTANGDNSAIVQSGNSVALVNNQTYANINSTGNNWLAFRINTLGNWEGQVINWGNPGATETGAADTFSLLPTDGTDQNQNGGTLLSINMNSAMIYNQLLLSANSGYNLVSADNADINTGNSTAIANIFNLANLNVFGSNWFWGTINVIGDWKGNAIFAYPDLAVNFASISERVKKGETVNYVLSFANVGYDVAKESKIEVDIPEGTWFGGDNSGLPREVRGNKVYWTLHDIEPKDKGSFDVWFNTGEQQSAFLKSIMVKPAIAAESESQLKAVATISTMQSESNLNNNSSVAATIVWYETDNKNTQPTNENESIRQPKWQITAKNNVNNFVNPGDVVTFEVDVKNVGEDTAYEAYITNQIFDSKGILQRTDTINLGEIEVGKGGKVNFGIKMPDKISRAATYTTATQVVGVDKNHQEIRSGKATTSFNVKGRGVAAVAAKEVTSGEVLGTMNPPAEVINYLPYLLLFIMSSFWIIKQLTLWRKRH